MAGVLFLSFTAILISRLTGYYALPPLVLAFWRDFLVSLGLLAVLVIRHRKLPRIQRSQVPFFVLYGLLLFVFNSIWTYSVPLNGAAVATVLAYGSVGFTVLLARWAFREQITLVKIIGVIFSLTGCVLVANALTAEAWNTRPFGIAIGLLTGLLYAFYNLAGKEAAHRRIDTWHAMFYSFGFATLFLLAANLIPGIPGAAGSISHLLPRLPPSGWALLVTLALGPTLLGFTLYNMSMNYLPVSIVNLIATLEPAFTAGLAYLLLAEVMSLVQVAGSLLVVGAVILVRISENGQAGEPEAPPLDHPTTVIPPPA